MKCPDCGVELVDALEKVPLQLRFASEERKRKLQGRRQTRKIHCCPKCGSKFILTLVLKKIA